MPLSSLKAAPRNRGQTRLKHDAILDAATVVFLNGGYAQASMDAIALEAGVSKATVYSHFGGKEALFGAIIEAQCRELMSPLLITDLREGNPEDTLRAVADRFMELVMSETALALYRVVMAEAPRFPLLAQAFYENGPARAITSLAAYLSEQADLGRLGISDPATAAEQFFSLLTGYLHVRTVLGIAPSPGAPDLSQHIADTVDIFLRACGHRAGAARAGPGQSA